MPRFVIHEHHATHLHYDLRLEKGGVLKCFAIPKGISTEKGKKRLAIQTEDHELFWLNFEGTIKEGYGKGIMKIYDKGQYGIKKWEDDKIIINFYGDKIRGEYVLVKLKSSKDKFYNKVNKKNEWIIYKL